MHIHPIQSLEWFNCKLWNISPEHSKTLKTKQRFFYCWGVWIAKKKYIRRNKPMIVASIIAILCCPKFCSEAESFPWFVCSVVHTEKISCVYKFSAYDSIDAYVHLWQLSWTDQDDQQCVGFVLVRTSASFNPWLLHKPSKWFNLPLQKRKKLSLRIFHLFQRKGRIAQNALLSFLTLYE